VISVAARRPRTVSRSWSRSAASLAADADDRRPALEARQDFRQRERTRVRVELVPAVREPRRRRHVVIRAQCHHQVIRLEHAGVGDDALRLWVERADARLHEAHARLHEVAVRMADGSGGLPPEHHVQLRVAEREGVAFV